MSTRAVIGIRLEDGSYRGIYSHFDGYPSGVGDTLAKHYTDPQKIIGLMDLGAISQLGANIDCPEGHNYNHPHSADYTIAYHRDRDPADELWTIHGQSWEDVTDKADHQYAYLFEDGQWFVSGRNFENIPLMRFVRDGKITDEFE